eukprot:gb/GECG01011802.1/.p1 GENE.gb/GECG01011802.1/~~gb/GECG01011802.1/.p1  ORF type:complete len:288 (+),score=14.69 gb/GECG01011802.1/:1-864(+)
MLHGIRCFSLIGGTKNTPPICIRTSRRNLRMLRERPAMKESNGFLEQQYEHEYPHSWFHLVSSCIQRQVKLTVRNIQLYGFRLVRAAIVGLILGSLFWNLGIEEFGLKLGVLTFSIIFLGFGNIAEIPESIKQRQIVQKQVAAKLYPTSAYTVAAGIMHVPVAALETLIMGTIVYWMVGFAEAGGRFLFFLLISFLANMVINVMFRIISYPSQSMEAAETQGGPIIGVMMVFGGYLIAELRDIGYRANSQVLCRVQIFGSQKKYPWWTRVAILDLHVQLDYHKSNAK